MMLRASGNRASHRSHAYRDVLAGLGSRHKGTCPSPQTNGKAERFIQTLINEWAYARPYRSNSHRPACPPALRGLLQSAMSTHSDRRPHAQGGCQQPPRTSHLVARELTRAQRDGRDRLLRPARSRRCARRPAHWRLLCIQPTSFSRSSDLPLRGLITASEHDE